mgnify:FL=1
MLKKLPNPKLFRKTKLGYSYNNKDINIKCYFKGTEPSPKGFGLCSRMVMNGSKAKGSDGNIWIKKSGRWVKDKSKKIKIKKYILKDGVEDTKTYKLNLVLLKKIKGVNARSSET